MDSYTAKDIKILTSDEAVVLMPWLGAETLASKYGKDVEFVRRGLEACRRAGVDPVYFIRRYLQGDKNVPFHEGVDYQMRVIAGCLPP